MQWVLLVAGGLLAGAMNAVAGGGTVVSFPVLVWAGIDPVAASATNSVGLFPATVAGVFGFRDELRRVERPWWILSVPAAVGGLAGAVLLLRIDAGIFEALAPWLVLLGSLLLAVREGFLRHLPSAGASALSWAAAGLVVFAVAVYAGFFGAGIGIMLLATLGVLGLHDVHHMNVIKNVYTAMMKGTALVWFAARGGGVVEWPAAVVLAVASALGALAGARLAYRIGKGPTRVLVVVIGVALAVTLLVRQFVL